jgi:RND family efflux transporter MFP subunit
VLAIVGIPVAVGLLGCGHHEAPVVTARVPPAAKTVAMVQVQLDSWPEKIRVQGSLLAYEDAVVGSKLAGRVDEVAVDLGAIVRKGDRLVTLVRQELDLRVQLAQAQLRQACATIGITPEDDETKYNVANAPGARMEQVLVTEAQNNMNRSRPLIATRSVTESEYEALVAQLGAAQARYQAALHLVTEQVSIIGVRRKELALAEQMVRDSEVVAPFAGVVGAKRVSPGEFVQAGQAVVTLVRAHPLRFTAGVPESRADALRVGQRVEIQPGGRRAPPIVAQISRVSPTVMQSSRSILVEADVANDSLELQAGLFAEADLIVDPNARAISVPASAVTQFAGVQKVWVITDGVAKQQTVRTGREENGRVEILEGLSVGNQLVLDAKEGHDGPVLAREEPSASIRAAELSRQAPKLENRSSSGAQ